MSFREEWRDFLDIISDDELRKILFPHYETFRKMVDDGTLIVPALEDILPKRTESGSITKRSEAGDLFCKELSKISAKIYPKNINDSMHYRSSKIDNQIEAFYTEYIKQGNELEKFLEAGADKILLRIDKMERYRRALDATKYNPDIFKLAYSCWRYEKADEKYKRKMYAFQVIVDAPNAMLDRIEYVTYRLSSAWPNPVRKVTNRSTKFELKELAWGASTIYADVKIKGQDDIITLSHPIVLMEEGPRLLFE